jgi:hypothetical protein
MRRDVTLCWQAMKALAVPKSAAQNFSKLNTHALRFALILGVAYPMKIMQVRGDVFAWREQSRLSGTAVHANGLPHCRKAGNAADIAPNPGCVERELSQFYQRDIREAQGLPCRP